MKRKLCVSSFAMILQVAVWFLLSQVRGKKYVLNSLHESEFLLLASTKPAFSMLLSKK